MSRTSPMRPRFVGSERSSLSMHIARRQLLHHAKCDVWAMSIQELICVKASSRDTANTTPASMAQPELKRRLMLRNRIILGLAPIFILLIAMGIYAVSLFAKLGGAVDVILRENFRSVLAAQNMKEAAERMDSSLFFSLVAEEERGRRMYEQNLPIFRDNLKDRAQQHHVAGRKGIGGEDCHLARPLCEAGRDVLEHYRSGATPADVLR